MPSEAPEPPRQPRLPWRASHDDRALASEVLTTAYAEGRLTQPEFEERLATAAQTREFDQLINITDDLVDLAAPTPESHDPESHEPRSRVAAAPQAAAPAASVIAFFAEESRTGVWSPPPKVAVRALLGDVKLDLGQAHWPGQRIEVNILAGLGEVTISVLPEVHVVNQTSAILGGTDITTTPPTSAAGRQLILTGVTLMGGIQVISSSVQPPTRR